MISQFDELNKKDFNKKEFKKKNSDTNIFSIKNISKTLKPTINKIIDNLNYSKNKNIRGRLNTSIRSNDSSFIKEKYINDLINEFEEDKSKSIVSRRSSCFTTKKSKFVQEMDKENLNSIKLTNNHQTIIGAKKQLTLFAQADLNKTVNNDSSENFKKNTQDGNYKFNQINLNKKEIVI